MSFQVDDYYEILALWNTVYLAKFGDDLLTKRELYASPLLLNSMNKMREALILMEEERGISDAREKWTWTLQINGKLWDNIVANIGRSYSDEWNNIDKNDKLSIAEIAIAPLIGDKSTLLAFIEAVTEFIANDET